MVRGRVYRMDEKKEERKGIEDRTRAYQYGKTKGGKWWGLLKRKATLLWRMEQDGDRRRGGVFCACNFRGREGEQFCFASHTEKANGPAGGREKVIYCNPRKKRRRIPFLQASERVGLF